MKQNFVPQLALGPWACPPCTPQREERRLAAGFRLPGAWRPPHLIAAVYPSASEKEVGLDPAQNAQFSEKEEKYPVKDLSTGETGRYSLK